MTAECLRCSRMRPIRFRGCCKPCCTTLSRQGRLSDYPAVRPQRPLAEAVEEYLIVRGRTCTAEEKAAALGYSHPRSMRAMLTRARRKGLLR